jgi:HAD superfamily hydrolase (TIGR01549 family)
MNIKGILFDMDGTLADTVPVCIQAYRQTFEKFLDRSVTDEEITANFGLSDEGIIRRMVPEQQAEAAIQTYYDAYEAALAASSDPFPDIKRALDLLKARGIEMGIVTGKGSYTAHLTLKYLGLADYFNKVAAGNEHHNVKAVEIQNILAAWQLEPSHAAYLGDADTDMIQSESVGVLPLAATWAETATIHKLDSMTPFATFSSIPAFIGWLDENIPLPEHRD